MDDHADEVVEIEDEYNLCEVIPLSRLTPNETAIDNGDITAFSVLFLVRDRLEKLRGRGVIRDIRAAYTIGVLVSATLLEDR